MKQDSQERIFQVVAMIPKGKVATYGQVAELAGLPRAARLVGTVLKNTPNGTRLPWHRVINAAGKISLPETGNGGEQKKRLEKEGVVFLKGKINLKTFGWKP